MTQRVAPWAAHRPFASIGEARTSLRSIRSLLALNRHNRRSALADALGIRQSVQVKVRGRSRLLMIAIGGFGSAVLLILVLLQTGTIGPHGYDNPGAVILQA